MVNLRLLVTVCISRITSPVTMTNLFVTRIVIQTVTMFVTVTTVVDTVISCWKDTIWLIIGRQKEVHIKLITLIFVDFKQDIYAVNIVNSTKTYFPSCIFGKCVGSYCICSHIRSCVSINCVTGFKHVRGAGDNRWLAGCRFEG